MKMIIAYTAPKNVNDLLERLSSCGVRRLTLTEAKVLATDVLKAGRLRHPDFLPPQKDAVRIEAVVPRKLLQKAIDSIAASEKMEPGDLTDTGRVTILDVSSTLDIRTDKKSENAL